MRFTPETYATLRLLQVFIPALIPKAQVVQQIEEQIENLRAEQAAGNELLLTRLWLGGIKRLRVLNAKDEVIRLSTDWMQLKLSLSQVLEMDKELAADGFSDKLEAWMRGPDAPQPHGEVIHYVCASENE